MFLKTAIRVIKDLFLFLIYKYKLVTLGVNESWVRDTYARFVDLDLDEFFDLGSFQIQAHGGTLHALCPNYSYQFTINENENKQLYVHEKHSEGEWVEVYRTNARFSNKEAYRKYLPFVDDNFVKFLREIEIAMDEKAEELRRDQSMTT